MIKVPYRTIGERQLCFASLCVAFKALRKGLALCNSLFINELNLDYFDAPPPTVFSTIAKSFAPSAEFNVTSENRA